MPPGGRQVGTVADQGQARGEYETGGDGNQCCAEGAEQVEQQNRPDVGLLIALVVGNRGGDQNKHQYRRHGFQGRNEHRAEEADAAGRFGQEDGQSDAGEQTDKDL